MSPKNIFLVLGLSLILAILISSDVSARELTEDTNTKHEEADHTNGLKESKYHYGSGYNRRGEYNGGGGYNRDIEGCQYGCCSDPGHGYLSNCPCCATASEAAQYKEANPHN